MDRAGNVVAADAGFRRLLGLPSGDPSEALRRRAGADPALAALLSGEGPASVSLGARDGSAACQLLRQLCDPGFLLSAFASPLAGAPVLEYALQAMVSARLAEGFAHEVKNPLNAMALQLALLGDKIDGAGETIAASCVANLVSIKNQIGRIDEVVRRQVEMADPTPATGFDAGALLADAVSSLGHEARRRRIAMASEAAQGTVRVAGDPVRAARLVTALLWRALADTPDSGRLAVRAAGAGDDVLVAVERTAAPPDPALAWVAEVLGAAASDMGGGLKESAEGDMVRTTLRLPKERSP